MSAGVVDNRSGIAELHREKVRGAVVLDRGRIFEAEMELVGALHRCAISLRINRAQYDAVFVESIHKTNDLLAYVGQPIGLIVLRLRHHYRQPVAQHVIELVEGYSQPSKRRVLRLHNSYAQSRIVTPGTNVR